MPALSRAMRALWTLARFDVATAGAAVARAAADSASEQQLFDDASIHCQGLALELRRTVRRTSVINPAQLNVTRQLLLAERDRLEAARTSLRTARAQEQRIREALGALRRRESALHKLLARQRLQAERRVQGSQMILADDLWLQQQVRREVR